MKDNIDDLWALLSSHPDNPYRNPFGCSENSCVAEDRQSGERWQYLGNGEFRHRMHPGIGRRLYIRVPAPIDQERIPTLAL